MKLFLLNCLAMISRLKLEVIHQVAALFYFNHMQS